MDREGSKGGTEALGRGLHQVRLCPRTGPQAVIDVECGDSETGGNGENEEGGGVRATGNSAGNLSAWWGEGATDEQSGRGGAGLVGPGDRELVRGGQS